MKIKQKGRAVLRTFWNEFKNLFDIRALLIAAVLASVLIGYFPGGLFMNYTAYKDYYDVKVQKARQAEELEKGRYRGASPDGFMEKMLKEFGPEITKDQLPKLEKQRQALLEMANRKIAENPVFAEYDIYNYDDFQEFSAYGRLSEQYARYYQTCFRETGPGSYESIDEKESIRQVVEGGTLYDPETLEHAKLIHYYDEAIETLKTPQSGGVYNVADQGFFNDIPKTIGVALPTGGAVAALLILIYFVKRNSNGTKELCYTAKTGRKLWLKQTGGAVAAGVLAVALFCALAYFLIEGMGMQRFYECKPDTILFYLRKGNSFLPENGTFQEIEAFLRQHYLYGMTIEQMYQYFIAIFFLFGTGLTLIATALFHQCRNLVLGSIGVIALAGVSTLLTLRYIYMGVLGDWRLLFRYEAVVVGALLCIGGAIALSVLYHKEKKKNF